MIRRMIKRILSSMKPGRRGFDILAFLSGAVIVATVNFFIPRFLGTQVPPPDSTITNVMDLEVLAAKTHDKQLVANIYAPDAVVIDVGCQSTSQSTAYAKLAQIQARYIALPEFVAFDHTNPHLIWSPNDSSATIANVTADTVEVLKSTTDNSSLKNVSLQGTEQWTFRKVKDNTWLITSLIYHVCLPRPSDDVITNLMDEDITAARNHDLDLVARIFSPDAFIIDAGCQLRVRGSTWSGLESIKERYRTAPQFDSLAHIKIQIMWASDDVSATATAETNGAIVTTNGSLLSIRGKELWTFIKIGGAWHINSFIYNLCLSSA